MPDLRTLVTEFRNQLISECKRCRACRDQEFAKDHSHDCGITRLEVLGRVELILVASEPGVDP